MTTVFTIGQHARLLLAEMLEWHWREARSVSAARSALERAAVVCRRCAYADTNLTKADFGRLSKYCSHQHLQPWSTFRRQAYDWVTSKMTVR
jgi:hypothetical protein